MFSRVSCHKISIRYPDIFYPKEVEGKLAGPVVLFEHFNSVRPLNQENVVVSTSLDFKILFV